MTLEERWRRLWTAARASGDPVVPYGVLAARYSEPHRAYHTLRHIQQCLGEFDSVREEAGDPVAVEWALWYHDAVYDTHRRDNEELSAQMAEATARAAGFPEDRIRRAVEMIRVSTHRRTPTDPDGRLFIDIDLSILGQPAAAFAAYERQVRKEYEWVPEAEFKSLRAEILSTFLDRFSIYQTGTFQDRYEKQARMNLTASVLVLRGGGA